MKRIWVAVMTLLLIVYLVFTTGYVFVLWSTGNPVAIILGAALASLPVLAAIFVGAEILFGVRSTRLGTRLEAEGGLPVQMLPLTPSGRIERNMADKVFPQYRDAVQENPTEWRAWFRLALAYDAAGDRRRARWATRAAIRLSREFS